MKLRETAERRQITILHCDIVNSTAIIDGLDPEEVLRIMETNLNSWTKIVADFRGIFVGYTGDGFNAYFGYPIAREDAATDAMSAAVQVSRLFSKQDDKIQRELECRIGVATGRVVIGQPNAEQIGHNVVAFGSAPCLAARLEQAAAPGHILVDSSTMKLTAGQFEFREVGRIQAKGFKQDVEAWEVVRKRQPVARFDSTNLSLYVGRDHELEILNDRWQSAKAGKGQVVLLQGESGIGKSRLVFELEQSLGGRLKTDFRFQCSSLNVSTALHPWFHWVLRFADIRQEDSKKAIHAKLNECLHDKLGFSHEVVTTSEAIMGFRSIGVEAPDEPAPQKVLARLQIALVENIINTAEDSPLFVLVEDVHWMDASTQSLVQLLIDRMRQKKIFLVLTCRPENVPPFDFPHVTHLQLTRLENEAVSDLVATVISDSGVSVDKKALMSTIEKCEGNPLFVEELSKHYLEQMTSGSFAAGHMSRG
ncbi:MAG: AAA family ATPase, partial [Rhizobiaceae bacterium]